MSSKFPQDVVFQQLSRSTAIVPQCLLEVGQRTTSLSTTKERFSSVSLEAGRQGHRTMWQVGKRAPEEREKGKNSSHISSQALGRAGLGP